MLALTIGLTALCCFILDKLKDSINDSVARAFFVMMITFVPTLYCILKNFPIAAYFKKEVWATDDDANSKTSHGSKHRESMLSIKNMSFNPINSWYSGNIHHRKR